jgi:serine/threonine protein kinase
LLKLDSTNAVGVVAKLCDFGLSARQAPGDTHISNYHCGSPFWVAPEVSEHKLLFTDCVA